MAQTIKIKRSSTSGNKLTSSNSVAGELGLNTADKALYIQTGSSNGDVVTVAHESTLKIDEANGRIGVGTTSPLAPLSVQADSGAGVARFIGRSSDSISSLGFYNSAQSADIYLQSNGSWFRARSDGGFHWRKGGTPVVTDTDGFTINGLNVGIGTTSPDAKLHVQSTTSDGIIVRTGANVEPFIAIQRNSGSNGVAVLRSIDGGDLRIDTGATGAAQATKMTIEAGGNVGIGTTSPDKMFVVQGAGAEIVISDTDTTDTPVLRFRESGVTSGVIKTDGSHMIFSAGGTPERMRIDSSGNVGIGTTAPGAPLDVKSNSVSSGNSGIRLISNSAGNAIVRIGEKSNDKARFHMYDGTTEKIAFYADGTANHISAGNLGIGTSAPSYLLHVDAPVSTDPSYIVASSGSNFIVGMGSQNSPGVGQEAFVGTLSNDDLKIKSNNTERIRVKADGKVGIGTPSPSQPMQINPPGGGYNLFFGRGNSVPGSSDPWLGLFNAATIGSATYGWGFYDSNSDGSLQIWNRNNSTTGAVALTIKRGGFVGIGTNSPSNQFVIKSGTNTDMEFGSESGGAFIQTYNRSDSTYGHLRFITSGETMRLTNAGSVGIGTTSPSGTLHVKSTGNGEVNIERASGALINLQAQASAAYIGTNANHLFGLKANGSVRLKISTGGAITFNDEYTFPTADGSANQVLKTDGSGNLSFVTIAGAGAITEIEDSDGDTKIQVEEGTDDDTIRFDIAGNEFATFAQTSSEHYFRLFRRGTTAKSSFSFDGTGLKTDVDSGYHSLVVQNNGTEQLRVTQSGRVGIGITAPSTKFQVKSEGADDGLYFVKSDNSNLLGGIIQTGSGDGALVARNSSNTQTVLFRGQGNNYITGGSLAIGHTSPAYQLHVAGAGDILVEDTAGGSAHLRLKSSASGTTTSHWKLKTNAANHFYIDNDQQGTSNLTILSDGRAGIGISAPTAALSVVDTSQTTTGQGLAGLRVHRPNATSQYGYVDYDHGGGGINVGSFYSGGGNSVYGTFMFRQHNAAGSQIPMAIGNTGNVGFGTTSPADKIHISGANLLFERGVELRSKDTGGNLRTLVRVNASNELEYGWSASGPVKFMGGTSYTERMRVHTNGFIGIGTTSPASRLQINGTSAEGWNRNIGLSIDGVEHGKIVVDSAGIKYRTMVSGDHHYFRNSANSTTLLVRDDGRVGIGTTSPARTLDIVGDFGVKKGSSAIAFNEYSNGATIWIDGSDGDFTGGDYFNISAFGTTDLSFGLAGASLVTFKSDGDVGIGTASPASALSSSNRNLTIEDSDGADIKFQHTGGMDLTVGVTNSNTGYIWTGGSYNILFGTAGTERMRLNSAGDLLIGKTSTGAGTAGIAFLQQDIITTTRDGGYSLLASRLSSDGEIIRIQRSGTTVGEIGSEGTDSLYISGATSTGSGLRFHPSAGNILPVKNRVTIDSTIDLGSSARRFRNIHASSAVNVGHASIQSDSITTSATTQVAIDAFVASQFRSAEFTIQVTNSTDSTYHITKVLLIHDGTTPGITEYGTVFTGSAAEATFDADISSGNVRLLATPASTDSMTFKVVRHCITV